jgi:hypothetical protein
MLGLELPVHEHGRYFLVLRVSMVSEADRDVIAIDLDCLIGLEGFEIGNMWRE